MVALEKPTNMFIRKAKLQRIKWKKTKLFSTKEMINKRIKRMHECLKGKNKYKSEKESSLRLAINARRASVLFTPPFLS